MNSLTAVFFVCLAAYASAGLLGARVVPAGPTTLIGASGVVGPNGAAGPTGIVTPHGAIGPNGIGNALGLAAPYAALGVAAPAIAAAGHIGAVGIAAPLAVRAFHDGQWRGEGLIASQDLTGQAARALNARAGLLAHGIGLRAW